MLLHLKTAPLTLVEVGFPKLVSSSSPIPLDFCSINYRNQAQTKDTKLQIARKKNGTRYTRNALEGKLVEGGGRGFRQGVTGVDVGAINRCRSTMLTTLTQGGSRRPCVNKTWGKWVGPKGEGFATGTNRHQLLFAFLYFLFKLARPLTSSDNCEEKFNLVICKSVNILARVTCTQCCSVLPCLCITQQYFSIHPP